MRLALAGQTYQARTVAAAAQSCINVYPERIEDPQEKEKGGALLIGCPGKHLFANLSGVGTPMRGIWSGGGRVWYAGGGHYAEIGAAGAVIGSIRNIADDAAHSPVSFFANGNQLFIVSAGHAYVDNGDGPNLITLPFLAGEVTALGFFLNWVSGDKFDPGMAGENLTLTVSGVPTGFVVDTVYGPTSLSLTTTTGYIVPTAGTFDSAPLFGVSSGAYGDGYFIASRTLSKQFNISALFDGSNGGTYVWNGLDFGVKESYPDYIRSILWSNEQLYLFGTDSGEVWQNIGSRLVNGIASFPFQRIDGATFKYGNVSPNSPIAIGDRVFFLGGDSTGQTAAYVLDGFTPRRISTFAIENSWNNALLGETAISASYLEEGHTFWEIGFGSGALTWVYDLTTGAWHQRASWDGANFGPYGRPFHTFVTNSASAPANDWGAGGKHLVGGDGTGNVYQQSLNFYDDAGADMAWQRALPYLYNGSNRMYYGRMTLDMETGDVASGAEPVITRDYSDDRGQTFIHQQTAGIGTHAQFARRVYWPPSGSSYGRVYRFTGAGKSKVALVSCDLEITQGVT